MSTKSPGLRRRPSSSEPLVRRFSIERFEERLLLSSDGLIHEINWLGSSTEAYEGQWILSLNGWTGGLLDQQHELENELKSLGVASEIAVDSHLGTAGLFRIDTPLAMDYGHVIQDVSMLPGFSYLEPDFALQIENTPNDPNFGNLWGLDNTGQSGGVAGADISAVDAWDVTTGSSDVVVGVVDTGIDYTHPDLADNIWVNPGEIPGDHIDNDGNGYIDDVHGWDFYYNDDDPMDYRSHGTHVAGTIGAVGNNGIGVTGVNWDVSLMALKIADDNPSNNSVSSSAATAALNYVADMRMNFGINIRVTSHSWGGGGYSTALFNAIQANANADILLVAAAGNDSRNNDTTPQYPASYNLDNIISVASTTRSDQLSGFSNYGATSVDLGAPGSSVYSTVPGGGYGTKSGTSMATPHVTGVAALAWAFRPDATYQEIKAAILGGVDPLPALDGITLSGGRLNAAHTLQLLGLNATPISPAKGAIVATPPTSFTVSFTDALDLATLTADDFQVNGIPADTLHVDTTKQITFNFNTSPVTLEGLQTMTMAAGAVTRTSDGYALNALNATFRYDVTTLAVTSISPAAGTTATYPVTQIDVTFNEPIAGASVGLDDLVLSQGAVTSAIALGTNVARYTVSGIENEGDITVSLNSSSVTDTYGNPMAPYSGAFQLDVDERTLANFTRVEPYGSLVSESLDNFGRLGSAADVDTLAIDMLAGETLLAVVRPTDPTATMTAEFEGLSAPIVGTAGAAIVVPLTQIAGDQTARLRITGDRATNYTYDVYRNAELEPLGAGNSTGLAIGDSRIDIAGTRYALIASTGSGATTDEWTIDWTAAAGQYADVLLTGLDGVSFAGQSLELYDPGNQLVATGADLVGAGTHDAQVAILGYQVGTPGVYTLKVASAVAGRYSLVVTQGIQFATEPNNSTSDALRSLDATHSAIGQLGTRIEDGLYSLALDTTATTFDGSGTVSLPSANNASAPLEEQSPGSLVMSAAGNVDILIQDGLIRVLNSSSLDFIEQAGSFAPGGGPADLAANVFLSPILLNTARAQRDRVGRSAAGSARCEPTVRRGRHAHFRQRRPARLRRDPAGGKRHIRPGRPGGL